MSRRTKDQRDQDRADLLAVLEEADGPLRTDGLVARALGYPSWNAMLEAYTPGLWDQVRQANCDLCALRRARQVASRRDPRFYSLEWRLATAEDLDANEDAREVERMQALGAGVVTVYVDDMRRHANLTGRLARWSHLMADAPCAHDQLMQAALDLGLRPEWIQHDGTHLEHFDVTKTVRHRAIAAGIAVPISYPRGTGELLARKRTADHEGLFPESRSIAENQVNPRVSLVRRSKAGTPRVADAAGDPIEVGG